MPKTYLHLTKRIGPASVSTAYAPIGFCYVRRLPPPTTAGDFLAELLVPQVSP